MSDEQPKSVTFYFDTTHGKLIPKLLRQVGLDVREYVHLGLSADADDKDWIQLCAHHQWVIISGDKEISRVPEERQAVIDGCCKVFMLEDSGNTRTEDWAASLLVARQYIIETVLRTNGPYFSLVKPCRVRGHIQAPEFIASGGWKPQEEWPTSFTPTIEHPKRIRPVRSRQAIFEFPDHVALACRVQIAAHCAICARLFGLPEPDQSV